MSNEKTDRKFNLTLIRAYATRSGNFLSVNIDSEAFDALQKVEIGGRLVLKKAKTKKSDVSPDAYFEYMTPEDVEKLKEYAKSQGGHSRKFTRKAEEDVL